MNKGKIIVAGIGPGSEADITPAVLAAIQSSDVIIGYKYYFRRGKKRKNRFYDLQW